MSVRARLERLEVAARPELADDGRGFADLLEVLAALRVPAAAGNARAMKPVQLLDAYEARHLTRDELLAGVREDLRA